ncbi:hypothetical protein [Neisseria sicca]|nr:hypothetical protein [Neisseria sicca]
MSAASSPCPDLNLIHYNSSIMYQAPILNFAVKMQRSSENSGYGLFR